MEIEARNHKVWTSKELEAVFCGVKLYGISRWPTIAHEVFEATLTDKGWGGMVTKYLRRKVRRSD